MIAKKPISLGMAISMAVGTLEQMLKIPGVEEGFEEKFSEVSDRVLTPEEFDLYWEEFYKAITERGNKQVGKAKVDKTS